MSWNRDEIIPLLLEAGERARRAKRSLRREVKADDSVVTQADREIEALITERLEDPARGAYIIGEETVDTKGEEYIARAMKNEAFVVDPIDGTSPFSSGLPNWGVSIGRMVEGRLVDGAVYLPEMGEIVLSTPRGVEEGIFDDEPRDGSARAGDPGTDRWSWRLIERPEPPPDPIGPIAITQKLAKRGRVDLPNPVMSLGAAVVPLVGLLQGRFRSYLGSVRLWDAAGALPLLVQLGFSISVEVAGQSRSVGREVDASIYRLAVGDPGRWYFHSSLLICHPGDEERMRRALVLGEGDD